MAAGKTVQEVGREAAGTVQEAISASARRAGLEVEGLTSWTVGDLPREFSTAGPGGPVTGYPALVDVRGRVDVRVLPSRVEQERAMRRGTRRLLLAGASVPSAGTLTDDWESADRLALTRAPHGSLAALVLDVAAAVVDDVVARHGGPAWDAAGFERLQDAVARELPGGTAQQLRVVARILASTRQVERAVTAVTSLQVLSSLTDVKDHLARLVRPGFVADTGVARLPDVQRYLRALLRRVEVLGTDPHRDAQHLWQVQELQAELEQAVASVPADSPGREALAEVRWMLEELRVSLFAQSIGTPRPVSPQRIRKALAAALAPPAWASVRRRSGAYFASSRRARDIRWTSSGPSARRRVRAAVHSCGRIVSGRDAGAAVHLDGVVDDALHRQRHRDLDRLDLGVGALVAHGVHQPGGLEHQQPSLLDAPPGRSATCSRTTPCSASGCPNATRSSARRHISSSARSAMPIRRMQWWIRPGPSRACAIANPSPSPEEDVRRRDADVVERDLGVPAVRGVVVAEGGADPARR